jgi:FKBP-type peptidyl-prolyl cis-trans isomerase
MEDVKVEELAPGAGPEAKVGDVVEVHYTGRFVDGRAFDASTGRAPFTFRLGKGEVIKGWERGVAGMRAGGKRRLTVPPELAYGSRGFPGLIPPMSTLVFEVELLAIR